MKRPGDFPASIEPLEPRLLMSRTLFSELFTSVQLVDVPASGSVSVSDQLDTTTSARMYGLTAMAKGKLLLSMAADGGGVDSRLQVFNAAGRRIKRNNNATRQTVDSRVRLNVKAGRTYYVAASAVDQTEG
ncbi:hypothetical protein LCGC14_2926120, partial [marine sediment metagenome]